MKNKETEMDKNVKETSEEEKKSKEKKEKQWEHCGPGEVPEVGEAVKCPDGEGNVEETHGHTVQVKLKNGFYWRGGIEQLKVLR